MAMYGLGPLAGLDGGGFMSDLVLVPYADAMLIPLPATVDPIAVASISDNIPDGWRAVGPFRAELAALDPADRRVLVIGRLSIGLYAAALAAALGCHVDYVDTDPARLAAAEKLGVAVHDAARPDKSWDPYPVTVHTTGDPSLLAAALRATWPDGVCTDTGIYFQPSVEIPMLRTYTRGVRFVTGRVSARAVIPEISGAAGGRLRSVSGRRPCCAVGRRALGLADDDRQDRVQPHLTGMSGDVADEHRDPADLLAGEEGEPLAVAARGQNPRVGDVDFLADEVHVGLTGGSTFFTQSVLPWASPIASTLPLR